MNVNHIFANFKSSKETSSLTIPFFQLVSRTLWLSFPESGHSQVLNFNYSDIFQWHPLTVNCGVASKNWRESRDRVGVTHDDRLQDSFEQRTLTLSQEWPRSLQLVFDLKLENSVSYFIALLARSCGGNT